MQTGQKKKRMKLKNQSSKMNRKKKYTHKPKNVLNNKDLSIFEENQKSSELLSKERTNDVQSNDKDNRNI